MTAKTISGRLGALRDRFGLVGVNGNTIDDEGVRTSFCTLVDMLVDVQTSWSSQRP